MKNKLNYSYCFLFMAFISCTNYAPSETFLIPENYKGAIVVVFKNTNKEDDQKKERIYNIPESGILYTPYSRTTGVLKHKYYYVDNSGNRVKEIKSFVYEDFNNNVTNNNEVYQLDMYDGVTEKNDKSIHNNKMIWIYFTLGTSQDDRHKLRGEAGSIVDSISKYYPEKYTK